MKKLFFLILILSNVFGYAQYTLIPDVNFENALINLQIDSGAPDGKVLTANISTLNSLDVSSKNITNLTGIQDFLALTNLNCFNNQLTNLDVTKNTSLNYLSCWNNQLTSLDVTKNISLTYLDCNANKLTGINVTLNTALTNLYCNDNKLTSFNVTLNTDLTGLACSSNQLTSLDVTKNTSLTYLSCFSNQLTSLNVIDNISLTYLVCSINQLTNLDVTKNTKLTELYCTSNQLTNLDVTNNTSLNALTCWNNKLTSLDVSKNTSLNLLYCDNNQLTSLDVTKNTSLTDFACSNNQLTSLNLKNGNNTNINIVSFNLTSNPNLTCIQVDDTSYSNTNWLSYKDASASYSNSCGAITIPNNNSAPVLIAQSNNQPYCPGSSLNIVNDMSITDTDGVITTIYIQISSGYKNGEDLLTLAGTHPTILGTWDVLSGKFTLTGASGKPSIAEFISAIKDIKYSSNNTSPSGIRTFSISIDQANYLPSNKHYYLYVPNAGISWTNAKTAAQSTNYYGLKGYLATITAPDEAQLCGAQASGNGWIGGSDAETEGVWKWVTGPENGTVFWNGGVNGSSPTYANWNSGEPNNSNNNEHYAHVKAPGVPGTPGSWNDLQLNGDSTGNYQSKGYIVEYGGTFGDPILQISTSTTITIPKITNSTPAQRCGPGSVTLKATASDGTVNWFDAETGGNLLATGNSYSTPVLSTNTTYYVDAGANCTNTRTPITATINTVPSITSTNTPVSRCGAGVVTLQASSDAGTINWYSVATGGNIEGTGTSFTTPIISQSTMYYAEAQNNGCPSNNRIPVEIKIYTPLVVLDQELTLCKSATLTLDAQIPNVSYLWSTGENTQTISIKTAGNYFVDLISRAPENCTSRKKINVIEHNIPEIDRVDVNETTIVIYLKKEEAYFEYSIDGINYQRSNVFFNSPSGLQTAYVREINFCSYDTKTFIVLITPKFFTPNNDTYNDVWEVKGLVNYPEAEVLIFDRYGKLITRLNARKLIWDGTFNNSLLPASDYWYVLKIDNTKPEVRGHFSLKR